MNHDQLSKGSVASIFRIQNQRLRSRQHDQLSKHDTTRQVASKEELGTAAVRDFTPGLPVYWPTQRDDPKAGSVMVLSGNRTILALSGRPIAGWKGTVTDRAVNISSIVSTPYRQQKSHRQQGKVLATEPWNDPRRWMIKQTKMLVI
ncbi:hypothetical protein MGYG_02239 [Nannizzia gypsea CBS 118893]|uniref:Uncharacterized protein n=1 Tax=Arthroderma gypseum (strain ATCC MYA-4604 / CBS 118893) TaxID=535722 RepID=E4UQJ6_ARTGP|nr:hypothetical protein MGYG_02239 [Nannizzia gypsea CBS 118893]EFQ99225.1 hypothetical protein MGYG_02239 [Nannizzia gypsea CBS 118893]